MKLELEEITHIQLNFHRKQFGYAPGEIGHDRHDCYGFDIVLESEGGELYRVSSFGTKHWIGRGEIMAKPLTLSVNVDPESDMVSPDCPYPSTPGLPESEEVRVSFGPEGLGASALPAEEVAEKLAALRKEAGEMLAALGALAPEEPRPCVNCKEKPALKTSLSCADCVAPKEEGESNG